MTDLTPLTSSELSDLKAKADSALPARTNLNAAAVVADDHTPYFLSAPIAKAIRALIAPAKTADTEG